MKRSIENCFLYIFGTVTQMENAMYRDRKRVVELLQQFKNKQQIMQKLCGDWTQAHVMMYSLFIGSLCNIFLSMT